MNLQRVLDEQGYLIVHSSQPRRLGEKLDCISVSVDGIDYEWIPGPIAIVGVATIKEYIAQCERYAIVPHEVWPYIFRAVAE